MSMLQCWEFKKCGREATKDYYQYVQQQKKSNA